MIRNSLLSIRRCRGVGWNLRVSVRIRLWSFSASRGTIGTRALKEKSISFLLIFTSFDYPLPSPFHSTMSLLFWKCKKKLGKLCLGVTLLKNPSQLLHNPNIQRRTVTGEGFFYGETRVKEKTPVKVRKTS